MRKTKLIIIFFIVFFFISNVNALNKSAIDITDMKISELNEYLEKEVITSEELIKLYLDRINTYNNKYNALITVNPNASKEAKKLDKLRSEGKIKGRLHGIPIIVKDNIDVYGMPTTAGAKSLANNMPKKDSIIVEKLRKEGAIILGKSNMSEFAFSSKNSTSSYGYVYNAYNPLYTSYGSSGGSAVAVALDFSPIALGTDTNSSVRLPANAANLVGLRPTYGLLSNQGIISYDINRDTAGVLTKYTEDNALILSILTDKQYDIEEYNLSNVKIGVPLSFYDGDNSSTIPANKKTYEPIKELLKEKISYFEKNGAKIIYLNDFYGSKEYGYNINSISGYTMCKAFNEYILNTTGTIRNFKDLTYSSEKITSLSSYLRSCNYNNNNINNVLQTQAKLRKYIDNIYKKYDLDFIMYPSTKNELYKKDEDYKLLNVSTTISSTIGYPSIVVPLGFIDNLPYGVEFLGLKNSEEDLYKLTYLYQKDNNYVGKVKTSAPPLYKVDENTKKLVKLYIENYDSDNEEIKQWLNKVYKYFRTYNKNTSVKDDSLSLINEYPKPRKKHLSKNFSFSFRF